MGIKGTMLSTTCKWLRLCETWDSLIWMTHIAYLTFKYLGLEATATQPPHFAQLPEKSLGDPTASLPWICSIASGKDLFGNEKCPSVSNKKHFFEACGHQNIRQQIKTDQNVPFLKGKSISFWMPKHTTSARALSMAPHWQRDSTLTWKCLGRSTTGCGTWNLHQKQKNWLLKCGEDPDFGVFAWPARNKLSLYDGRN